MLPVSALRSISCIAPVSLSESSSVPSRFPELHSLLSDCVLGSVFVVAPEPHSVRSDLDPCSGS